MMTRSGIEVPRITILKHRRVTADILYRLPDAPLILGQFIWQDDDIVPEFPVLKKFLRFWQRNLDGKLYRVTVASVDIFKARGYRPGIEVGIIH